MKTRDYFFDLPEELIAQHPSKERGRSRLLVLDRSNRTLTDSMITRIQDFLPENALLVVNNSKVRKARLYGNSEFGGRVEFLLLRERTDNIWLAMVSKAKKQKIGKKFRFPGEVEGVIVGVEGAHRLVRFDQKLDETWFNTHGHIPLPPYIRREDAPEDGERYQTVYSRNVGSVAAPTAGLHFTGEIMDALSEKGIRVAQVTLHVGLGTFLPVRTKDLRDHQMHTEEYEIEPETAESINTQRVSGGKVIAVGTTSVRTLESAFRDGAIHPGKASTRLFIYPGYRFQAVDHLVTNFHTPESSLLMLVSAFAGKSFVDRAYAHAVAEKYRFFSYGDAMLIL